MPCIRQRLRVALLLVPAACGSSDAASPITREQQPARTAHFEVVEGTTTSISRNTRDPKRFTATFTLENNGGTAGRPECELSVGTQMVPMRRMPILEPSEERYFERSVAVKKRVWEIDGDVYCE